jgi:hypothetical protein
MLSDQASGKHVPVDLAVLVQEVRIAPTAPDWFQGLVESVCTKYALQKPVLKSSLADEPL